MDWVEFTDKTVDAALIKAAIKFETTSDKLEYLVIEKESKGILGMFSKAAKIKVRKLETIEKQEEEIVTVKEVEVKEEAAVETIQQEKDHISKFEIEQVALSFLNNLFDKMDMDSKSNVEYNEANSCLNIDLSGGDMGVLIGKRGQTLDSIQYLVSLVVNRVSTSYVKVKLDTENYRQRRKDTLENLAKNIAYKVKKTKRPVSLEPMNPYERRIIHASLQNDKFIDTHSEGVEPYRRVVVSLKKGYHEYKNSYSGNYQKRTANYNTAIRESMQNESEKVEEKEITEN